MATNLDMLGSYTSPVRTVGAQITLTDGTTPYTFTEQDKLKSATIERTGNNAKFFGYGVSQKLNVKALDIDREVKLTTSHSGKLQLKVNNGAYTDASPDFTVSEVHRDEITNEISITAYDVLHETNKYTFADLGLTAPYNLRDVAEAIGGKIGANGVDSNHFSPNLVKPIDEWGLASGATRSDGWIHLSKSGSYANYFIPWNYKTPDKIYIKATLNSDEEVYGYYIGLQLTDDAGKVLTTYAAKYSSEVSGEITVSCSPNISKATLKKTKTMRIFLNYRAAACRFKNVILSTTDVPYTPYGSDRAIRNLTKPIEEWTLHSTASRSDGWINIAASSAYADDYIDWNYREQPFYFRATISSDAEVYGYYVGIQLVDENNNNIGGYAPSYSSEINTSEYIVSFCSSSKIPLDKLKQTKRIRVFFNPRANTPYRFKDVRISLTDGEYVPYEGAPFTLTYETGANYEGTETLQEVLNDIAGATQTIYYINNSGTLYFKKLDIDGEPVATVDKNMYITLDSSTNRRLSKVISATELGDNLEAATTVSGSTQIIRDNPFWDLREDRADLVNKALYATQNLTINQFTCSWRGFPFLEVGDKIALTTKEDNTVLSYLLSDTLEYNGALSQNTGWKYENSDTETAANPTNLGDALKQTYAKVDKANKRIELVASDVSDTNSKVASLEITTEGIRGSVTEVDKKVETTKTDLQKEISDSETSLQGDIADAKSELEGDIAATNKELETVKTTVSTHTTQIEQNAQQIGLKASKEEVTTTVTTYVNDAKTEVNGNIDAAKEELEAADAANKELIDANAISVQTIEKSVSELAVNAEGISASVENITKTIAENAEGVATEIAEIHKKVDMQVSAEDVSIAIQTEMAKGTDKVITSTGYKFDEEGLTVSKTDSEMETKITEDGMVVYKNGDAVLTANNQGVDAKNLHATTYLIVGTNSRFEDYGNRTGCFWVGGA